MRKDEKAMDSQACDSNLTAAHDQKEGRKVAQEPTQTKKPNSTKSLREQTPLNGWKGELPDLGWAGGIFLRQDLPEPQSDKPKRSPKKQ